MTMRPLDESRAAAAACHNHLLDEMSQAHQALRALFGGVQEVDTHSAVFALDQLAAVGERLDCPELVSWCRGEGRRSAEASLDAFVSSLPQLLALWERAQGAVIAKVFLIR